MVQGESSLMRQSLADDEIETPKTEMPSGPGSICGRESVNFWVSDFVIRIKGLFFTDAAGPEFFFKAFYGV